MKKLCICLMAAGIMVPGGGCNSDKSSSGVKSPCDRAGPGVNMSSADLSGCNLEGRNLEGADFSGADLRGANLLQAHLQDANLE